MNLKIVAKILGLILIFLSFTMLLPLPFAYYYDSQDQASFIFSFSITFLVGILAFFSTKRNLGASQKDIHPKEGFAIVGFGWVALSLFGALPYVISGAIPSYTDAFFETMSGFTTTGASILSDIEALPKGILFWRSFSHWIGGMGIIVFSIAILPFLGVAGMQLFKAEVPGPTADKLTPRITETAKILWGVYFMFTIIETVLLMFAGINLYDALCHTFGTMATGGFSTKNASIAAFNNPTIDYIIIFFMIIAGANFALHYRVLTGNYRELFRNEELKYFLLIIIFATAFITYDILRLNYVNLSDSIRHALFQVVSIMTTTGYGTFDYEKLSATTHFILLLLMFIGGCAGSTGGGLKVVRSIILTKYVYTEIKRLIHPKAIIPVRFGGRAIEKNILSNISAFFIIYLLISVFSILLLTLFNVDIVTSLGAVAACINNIGPGLADVGPTDNYSHFHPFVKWFLSFLMLLGRLEIFTILVLLTPAFWKK
ncbi:MAG TPA: TrkH family potassium uptake protein [Candidatus Kapabacteria bacterium]|nr:TrkH family potassium uptake protein [Candidatus Kapabacteria bacterium]